MKLLDKRNTLFFWFLLVVVSFGYMFLFPTIETFCYSSKLTDGLGDGCVSLVASVWYLIAAITILVSPALLTIPFRISVFEAWRAFAIWAVPITLAPSILLVLFGGSGNAYMGDMGFGALLLFIPYTIYFLISIIVITIAVLRGRKSAGR